MKKIIRRVFLCIFAVFFAGIAALVVYFTHDPDRPVSSSAIPKVTDTAGNTYLAVTDKKSKETYAVVSDADGKVYAAEINDDGSIGEKVSSLDGQYSASDLPSNYTGPKIDESVNPNDFTGNVNVVASETHPVESTTKAAPKEDKTPETPKPAENTTEEETPKYKYRIEKYQEIFSSGTYLMEFTTDDEELGSNPITTAVKNGNLLIDAEMQDMKCKMLFLSEKNATYLILDKYRKYCKLPEDLIGDELNMADMNVMSSFSSEVQDKDIEVSTVELNGQSLTCESYVTEDGTTMKYYFSGDTLVRLDNIDKSGTVTSTYFSKITSDVPDSTFDIPSNYGFLNLALLGAFVK
ncbi:MAG: hypothetical protein NC122_05525 [Faecalibacterium sp.]|nr:hypothetical protein [Ruminococcus sp.]MCM1392895.1 hypothetical protein [Ruminococcus sp.]MCM1485648.1 hypothetical protein [Faecalibacterium sp.]